MVSIHGEHLERSVATHGEGRVDSNALYCKKITYVRKHSYIAYQFPIINSLRLYHAVLEVYMRGVIWSYQAPISMLFVSPYLGHTIGNIMEI
jgi:hypothetical protein